MVASYIIETYSGKHYTSFVEDRIFAPLGMSSSTFSPAKAAKTGKFTQGWTSSGRLLPEWFSEDMVPLMAGPGGVISNAVDMAGTSRLHHFHWPIVFFISSSPNGLHCGLTRVCTTTSQSYRHRCIETHRSRTRCMSVHQSIPSTRFGGMEWVGPRIRTSDTM
jgi:hypothetical protein